MNTEPLNSDPKRQAAAVIRAFNYQILHSIYAWLELGGEDEVLYLEVAEDFDVVGKEIAKTTQVKNSATNLTLRSKDVLDAIYHCWMLVENNKDRAISFRFITSAKIGKEQGGPFGKGIAGIDLWQQCQRDSDALEKIIEFLTSQSSLSKEFLDFLNTADKEVVLEKVIRPIQWLTESGDAGYVQQAIERKLIIHGDKFGIGPTESLAVIPRLKEIVYEKASLTNQAERLLDRVLFLQVFEDATMITVSRSVVLATNKEEGTNALAVLGPSLLGESALTLLKSSIPIRVPPLQLNFFNRESLISEIQKQLHAKGVLVLSGSSGMGKSTIAKLMAQSDKDSAWLWMNFTGRSQEQLQQSLQYLGRFIDEDPKIDSIVLDDLALDAGLAREIEDYLGGLLFTIINRSGQLLITSHRQMPGRLCRHLSVNDANIVDVPPFIEEEITLFAQQLGCKDTQLANNWAKIVFMHTKGHPQLVHAHLLHLKNVGWPAIKQGDLLSPPPEVIDERNEARSLLLQLDDEQRQMLYRLSIVKGPFRRDQAIAIGSDAPPLQYPGDAFNLSIGPWVEPMDEEYFRLSPLLENAAEEVWSTEVLKSLYASTARNILSCGELTLIEASNVFFNAWRGKADNILVGVIGSLLHSKRDIVWASVIEEMSWIIHLCPQKESFYPENHLINFMFRNLQFNIAADIRPEIAADILSVWETEISDYEPRETFLVENFLLHAQAITHYKVALSSAKLLTHILKIVAIQSEYQALTKKSLFAGLPPDISSNILPEYFLFIVARCKSKEYLESLLENLNMIPADLRAAMLGVFNTYYSLTMINSVWMSEVEKDDPVWSSCISILEKTLASAISWEAYDLAVATIRAIAIVKDEYLNDAAGALEFINKHQDQYASPFLRDEESSIYLGMEQYAKTLEICEEILPDWEPLVEFHDYTTIFTYRKGGISAAKLEDWQKSGALFQDGAKRAELLNYPISHAALIVDASYSYFKAQDYSSMLHALREAFQLLERLSEQEEGINVRKVASHYLLWIFTNVIGEHEAGLAEPAAGKCSDPSIKNDADLETIPLMPFDLVWPTLAVIEHSLGLDAGLYEIATPFKHSKYSMARRYVIEVEIGRSIREKQIEDFPGKCLLWVKEMQFAHQEQVNKGKHPWEPDACSYEDLNIASSSHGLLTIALMSGLVVLAAENSLNQKVIKTWKDNAALQKDVTLSQLVSRAEEILFSVNSQEIVPMINNSRIAVEERIFAALRGSLGDITKPEYVLNANYAFVHPLLESIWLDDISDHLCKILANQWLRMTQFKGQFSTPTLTVPELEAACTGLETGVCKIQNIFLAASDATSKRLPDDFVKKLRSLCNKQRR